MLFTLTIWLQSEFNMETKPSSSMRTTGLLTVVSKRLGCVSRGCVQGVCARGCLRQTQRETHPLEPDRDTPPPVNRKNDTRL